MTKYLFISHSTKDKKVVQTLANIIERVSLNQIKIWFSSDSNRDGGFIPDDTWYNKIINNLKKSSAVISFITPNSNNQPWLLYESGFAEALDNTLLIPLKFLLGIDDIPSPIKQKQIFSFSTFEEADVFLDKVLGIFNITYDKEIYHSFILNSINNMRREFIPPQKNSNSYDDSIKNLELKIESLVNCFNDYIISNKDEIDLNYEFTLEFQINNQTIFEHIKISPNIRVSDILDAVYFILNDRVKAFTYLQEWILLEKSTGRHLVISEIQDRIPAYIIFKKNSVWVVELLNEPYQADSEVKSRFYSGSNLDYCQIEKYIDSVNSKFDD